MANQGLRIKPSTKERIEYLAKLCGKSRSEVVAEKIDGAPPVPKVESGRVPVSYSMSDSIVRQLQALSQESGMSQGEVIDYLFRSNP